VKRGDKTARRRDRDENGTEGRVFSFNLNRGMVVIMHLPLTSQGIKLQKQTLRYIITAKKW